MQHFLKSNAGAARAGIVTAEFFEQFFVPVYDAVTVFDACFRWESFLAFTAGLETNVG